MIIAFNLMLIVLLLSPSTPVSTTRYTPLTEIPGLTFPSGLINCANTLLSVIVKKNFNS